MRAGPDIGAGLAKAIEHAAIRAMCTATVVSASQTAWASATFTGARHRLTLVAPPGQATDDWLAGLPDVEFDLRGHLVADLAVTTVNRRDECVDAVLEILTVEVQ